MGIFAETYVLKVDLPYSEYWLPLLIGMGVGICALSACKLVSAGRKKHACKKPAQPIERERDPFTEGSPSELRKSYRRQGNPTEVYIALPDQKNRSSKGWVIDRSMGGLGIQASDEVKPGTQLAVLPVNAPPLTPWVDIQVRTCREIPEGHELGCQFLKTPNWSVLLMFG
jgi:hypothetical protein